MTLETSGAAAWPRCSYVAQDAGDAREGTAPPADRWFLVEHPGPWGRIALTQSGVEPAAVAALSAWSAAGNGRVLLVRSPGRSARADARRWFRVDSRPGRETIRTGLFTDENELVDAVTDDGVDHVGPLHLVCAHGRHDTCCAVRGRPLAALVAAEAGLTSTWECSHVGGCRFAPALVLLPHGFVLGGVPATDVAALVHRYREARIDPRWLRGRSSLPPAVQAAQHHARLTFHDERVAALTPLAVARDGASGWHVTLADPDCTVRLQERFVDTGRPLTCASTALGRMRVFDLVELRHSAA